MQESYDQHQLRRVLFSLITSILATFTAVLALSVFLDRIGLNVNYGYGIVLACTLFAAMLYSTSSVSSLQYPARKTISKVARNVFVAVVLSLLFITISSVPYRFEFFPTLWWFFYSLVTALSFWTFVAFVAISTFSFEYSRRGSIPSEAPIVPKPIS